MYSVHNSRPADAVRVDGVHGVHRAVVLLVLTLQSRMFPIAIELLVTIIGNLGQPAIKMGKIYR